MGLQNNKLKRLQTRLSFKNEQQVIELLEEIRQKIKFKIYKKQPVTKAYLLDILNLAFKHCDKNNYLIKKEEVLQNIRHKGLHENYNKFVELYKKGFKSPKIEKYFKNTLKCNISRPTILKAIKVLEGQENG